MEILTVRPFEVRFTQNTVSDAFKNNIPLVDSLYSILTGELKLYELPKIICSVFEGHLWVVHGNRRLFLFQKLEAYGLVHKIKVKVKPLNLYLFNLRYTSLNSGISVMCFVEEAIDCLLRDHIRISTYQNVPLNETEGAIMTSNCTVSLDPPQIHLDDNSLTNTQSFDPGLLAHRSVVSAESGTSHLVDDLFRNGARNVDLQSDCIPELDSSAVFNEGSENNLDEHVTCTIYPDESGNSDTLCYFSEDSTPYTPVDSQDDHYFNNVLTVPEDTFQTLENDSSLLSTDSKLLEKEDETLTEEVDHFTPGPLMNLRESHGIETSVNEGGYMAIKDVGYQTNWNKSGSQAGNYIESIGNGGSFSSFIPAETEDVNFGVSNSMATVCNSGDVDFFDGICRDEVCTEAESVPRITWKDNVSRIVTDGLNGDLRITRFTSSSVLPEKATLVKGTGKPFGKYGNHTGRYGRKVSWNKKKGQANQNLGSEVYMTDKKGTASGRTVRMQTEKIDLNNNYKDDTTCLVLI